MFDWHQKRKFRTLLHSPYVHGLLAIVAVLLLMSAYERYQVAMEMSVRRVAAEQELTALVARKDELAEDVQYLSNERGIEAEMRRQFDVSREGEQVVVIVDDEDIGTASSTGLEASVATPAWYEFWR